MLSGFIKNLEFISLNKSIRIYPIKKHIIKEGHAMIKIENLSYSFPKKDLFNSISFNLEGNDHCAFIGASGSGKSTLIDIILNPDRYMHEGDINLDPMCRIAYVSQFSQLDKSSKTTVFEYVAETFLNLQNEIESVCKALESSTDIDPLLERYQVALDTFASLEGDDFESNINKKLSLANLHKHKDLMISELSGGEFKLVQVIKEMLSCPNLIIMDEPDVFLDFENLNALKNLINSHRGIILIVTHNRFLLNHCFNKIIHLENTSLESFEGSYIQYNFSLLQKKIELQELAMKDDEEMARNEVIINRLRMSASNHAEASKGKALKARVKIQERLEARRTMAPFVDINQPNIDLTNHDSREDSILLRVKDYSLAFEDVLLENVNFEIKATDKVALIGANGTGKTTLLKAILKNRHPGIQLEDDVEVAYLSQLQGEILNESNSILDEFFDVGFESYSQIRSYLYPYGFDEEILHQKIESLSGGEKNLLQLAKISARPAGLLLLDEPTSHLDIYAQIALEKAIQKYRGGVIMISHDYYSIVNAMDYVLLIENKGVRKITMRKFRKMIYASHFDKDYLLIEEKKKDLEVKIARALKNKDFEAAKVLSLSLEALILDL